MVRIVEQVGGKKGTARNSYTREKTYHILGTRDADLAYSLFFSHIMSRNNGTYDGVPLDSLDVEEDGDGGKLCVGTVKWSNKTRENLGLNIPSFKFSTKGATAKVRYSLETVQRYGRDNQMPPNFRGGINYQNGRFEGTEVVVPKWIKTVSIKYQRHVVNARFERMMLGLTGTVNNASFLGLNAGEVLFNGVDTSDSTITRENGQIIKTSDLVFEFLGMPNVRGMMIGDIGPIDKDGWDFVWEFYREIPDFGSKNTIHVTEGIFVERMYDRQSFNVFGF